MSGSRRTVNGIDDRDRRVLPNACAPLDDELLSAFVVRNAHSHGAMAPTFAARCWPGLPLWTRDTDRWAGREVVAAIAADTGIELDRALAMTLASCVVAGGNSSHAGTTPFVGSVGVYHRARQRWGLQYCPHCLRDARVPTFRRAWRLACVTRCPEHGCELHDACHSCGVPIVLHWSVPGRLTGCPSCGADLAEANGVSRGRDAIPVGSADKLAGELATALLNPSGRDPVGPWFGRDGVAAVRTLISVVSAVDVNEMARAALGLTALRRRSGEVWQLELARWRERRALMEAVAELVQDWPDRFREVARVARLTRLRFERLPLPAGLAVEVGKLRSGCPRTGGRRSVLGTRDLRRLKRRDPAAYRRERGARLWTLVMPPVAGKARDRATTT